MKKAWLPVAAAGLLWATIVLAGGYFLLSQQFVPGVQRLGPASITPTSSRSSLVLFLHPKCPCSSATVEQLDKLMATTEKKLDVKVFFVGPAEAPAGWRSSALVARAQRIPGIEVLYDGGGAEARRYGALTSGQAYLFDPSGKRLFQGGLTDARGHEGDNAGCDSIETYAKTGMVAASKTPVFGCAFGTLSQGGQP